MLKWVFSELSTFMSLGNHSVVKTNINLQIEAASLTVMLGRRRIKNGYCGVYY